MIVKYIVLVYMWLEFGVICGGLIFVILVDGVVFGSDMFDLVKLVIIFVVIDLESYLEVLLEFVEVFMDEEKVICLIEVNLS